MNIKITVPEVFDFLRKIQKREKFFEMIWFNVQEEVGKYLSKVMGLELSHFLGLERYERKGTPSNHRNDSYHNHLLNWKASFLPLMCNP
jgi:putative transposase